MRRRIICERYRRLGAEKRPEAEASGPIHQWEKVEETTDRGHPQGRIGRKSSAVDVASQYDLQV
jgi:hypothetical protein